MNPGLNYKAWCEPGWNVISWYDSWHLCPKSESAVLKKAQHSACKMWVWGFCCATLVHIMFHLEYVVAKVAYGEYEIRLQQLRIDDFQK